MTKDALDRMLGEWTVDPTLPLEAVKKAHVLAAYEHFGRNRTHTARSLGVDGKTLFNWLKAWGAPPAAQTVAQRWDRRCSVQSRNGTDSKP